MLGHSGLSRDVRVMPKPHMTAALSRDTKTRPNQGGNNLMRFQGREQPHVLRRYQYARAGDMPCHFARVVQHELSFTNEIVAVKF